MDAIQRMLRRLLVDRSGATAIEYALIASLIVIAIIGGLAALGGGSGGMWSDLSNTISDLMS